ncbi:MAG: FHA domain-containing protein [Candidatus Promineifilaceae bacterium]
MRNRRRKVVKALLLLIALGLLGLQTVWAQSDARLDISSTDASAFPIVKFNLIASDNQSNRLQDLSGLQVSEDDRQVTDFELAEVPEGVEVIFVIDANASINLRDDNTGLSRREKVRDSINLFATDYMNQSQLDRVSIIVPDREASRLLLDTASFPNEVINAVNFYEPGPVGPTPLNDMINLAIEHARATHEEGHFQAVVLFTDAGQLERQLDYPALVDAAQSIDLPIFVAILGAQASEGEIANAAGLFEPTRGTYVHMPLPEEAAPIYSTIRDHGQQYEIAYRSSLASSGAHSIATSLGGVGSSAEVNLQVEPPTIELGMGNEEPIRRVVTDPNSPLSEAQPSSQPILASISWPDNHPRLITEASLIVDGQSEATLSADEINEDSSLAFDWDISGLDEGTYDVAVSAVDELGLQGSSDVLPFVIVVEGMEPPPVEATAPPASESVEAAADAAESGGFLQNLGVLGIVFGLLAVIVAGAAIVAAIVIVQRRSAAPAAVAPQTAPAAAQGSFDETQVIVPAFATKKAGNAYFEVLENAPEHTRPIPLASGNVTIGRDPKLAQIVFADKSVSRLHARIAEKGGGYQLFDEGSASGTYVNYEQLGLTPQPIRDNDDVHIGRVHLRFHVAAEEEDADSTQVMPAPQQPARPGAPAADEGLSTQPFMPNEPPSPGAAPPPERRQDDDDEDGISTEPFMPHAPRR